MKKTLVSAQNSLIGRALVVTLRKDFQVITGHSAFITSQSLCSFECGAEKIHGSCLWKEILSQQRIRHFKILQSIYFADDVASSALIQIESTW